MATERGKGRRVARQVGGWALLVAGVAGCVLPVIPGIPLLIGGLALLAPEYAWAGAAQRRVTAWIARRRRGGTAQPPAGTETRQP